MPIGSPRVSLVNSILDTRGKGLEKLEENSPDSRIPLARYGWGKTSLTLESIFMRDLLEENVSKRNENFRTKIDRNPATRRSLFEKGRIERFTCIARNKIDAVGNNEREERGTRWKRGIRRKTMRGSSVSSDETMLFPLPATMLASINRFTVHRSLINRGTHARVFPFSRLAARPLFQETSSRTSRVKAMFERSHLANTR